MDVMPCVSNRSFIMAEIGLRRITQKNKQKTWSMITPINHRHCGCLIWISYTELHQLVVSNITKLLTVASH